MVGQMARTKRSDVNTGAGIAIGVGVGAALASATDSSAWIGWESRSARPSAPRRAGLNQVPPSPMPIPPRTSPREVELRPLALTAVRLNPLSQLRIQ